LHTRIHYVYSVCMCIQETIQLFRDIRLVSREKASEEKTKLICLLCECGLVEVVQKMWRRYFSQEMLEQMKELPDHLFYSLRVTNIFFISRYIQDYGNEFRICCRCD